MNFTMLGLVLLTTIGLVSGDSDVFKLQFDDNHFLYCDGNLMSSGETWNKVYQSSTSGTAICATVAVYAENTGGPKGMMLTIDDQETDISAWQCKTVASFAEANSDHAGWNERYYDTSDWGPMEEIKGPSKAFQGGPWMWAKSGGDACICRLVQGETVEFQVDDEHKLFDAYGEVLSSGTVWNRVYKTVGIGPFSLFAENTGGPYAFFMKINGAPVDASSVRCKAVSGTEAEIDAKNSGWKTSDFDASVWGIAVTPANPTKTNKLRGGTNALWAQCGCAAKVICKIDA